MPSPKANADILRIIPFGVIWFLFGVVYVQMERGMLGHFNFYPSTGNPYHFEQNLLITPLFALVAGLSIGVLEVKVFYRLFQKRSFRQKIILKSLIYLLAISAFLIVTTAFANANELGEGFFSRRVWQNVLLFFTAYAFFAVVIYIAAILVVSLFYTEVSESLGRGVLANFFTGKYSVPLEEQRIFLFLDMKSSTSLAESLGHLRYFHLLRDYFADLSDAVVQHGGEVYQYVGDELVVSWRVRQAQQNNDCIFCFVAMKAAMDKQADRYIAKFGVAPQFKAGLHVGAVTAGEIGVIKKNILFTGDVLNATSRIQGLCNSYGVDLLISGELKNILAPHPSIRWRSLGSAELRGREEKVDLFTTALMDDTKRTGNVTSVV